MMMNVQIILHVSKKNAKTHVLILHVERMQNAEEEIIVLYVHVLEDMRGILTPFVLNVSVISEFKIKKNTK